MLIGDGNSPMAKQQFSVLKNKLSEIKSLTNFLFTTFLDKRSKQRIKLTIHKDSRFTSLSPRH